MKRLIVRKRLMLAGAVLAGLLLIWFLFLRPPAKRELVTAQARTGDIEEVVLATGVLEPLELVRVGAQALGRVERLAVEVSDVVEALQLVAEIYPQTRRSTLRDRQANLANTRAVRAARALRLVQAQQDFERQHEMLAADATPRARYDAVAARNSAQAEVRALEKRAAEVETDDHGDPPAKGGPAP